MFPSTAACTRSFSSRAITVLVLLAVSICAYLFIPTPGFAQAAASPTSGADAQLQHKVDSAIADQNSKIDAVQKHEETVLDDVTKITGAAIGILGVLTVIIAIIGFVQMNNDSRIMKMLQKELDHTRDLTGEYRKNIADVNTLIGTINQAITFANTAQHLQGDVDNLRGKLGTIEIAERSQVQEINSDAVKLFDGSSRLPIDDSKFKRAAGDLTAAYHRVVKLPEARDKINAACLYIVALNSRIENDYPEAERFFLQATELAGSHVKSGELYPGVSEYTSWIRRLKNHCHYHRAILLYNQGKYENAIDEFRAAVDEDPSDLQSMTYIPEAMFLRGKVDFQRIVAEFENVIAKVNQAPVNDGQQRILAQCYLKLGNCYFGGSANAEYRAFAKPEEAERYYRLALELDNTSDVIRFSLAQALRQGKASPQEYRSMFKDLLVSVRAAIGGKTEAKILMMLYYTAALCASYADVEPELIGYCHLRIQELRPRLPEISNLTIFSPKTKRDLTVKDFLKEVADFVAESQTPAGVFATERTTIERRTMLPKRLASS